MRTGGMYGHILTPLKYKPEYLSAARQYGGLVPTANSSWHYNWTIRRSISINQNASTIRQQLRDELDQAEPRSVTERAKALDIDIRHLYIQATTEARALGEHYVQYLHQRALQAQVAIHAELLQACEMLHGNGKGITVEQVANLVEPRTLNSTRHLYTVLSNLAGRAANDATV